MSVKNNATLTEKLAKLDDLVAWFDGDDFELEQALEKFTEAEKLAAEIENDLLALKNTITVVKEKFDKAL
ncbi:exodeoxyribonuclease VII small subunit [Streptomyces caniscabiei]|uniref:exodeoxyribonuclease VII small subunit n=1 Tax=Streptomyces caniscabiei TaxID=2746961 RepID=UPI0029BF60F0|nr:exodeoxyribonuclease VII small subunit [Streptomyces caniscabiei]MDX2776193.1 exodeoxyribonuclease VII small subunit [Streptomyces caniscabiei]